MGSTASNPIGRQIHRWTFSNVHPVPPPCVNCTVDAVCVPSGKESEYRFWQNSDPTTCANMQKYYGVCNKPKDPNYNLMMQNCPVTCAYATGKCGSTRSVAVGEESAVGAGISDDDGIHGTGSYLNAYSAISLVSGILLVMAVWRSSNTNKKDATAYTILLEETSEI